MRNAMQYAICVLAFQARVGIPFTIRKAMQYAIYVVAFQAYHTSPKDCNIYI